MSSLVEILSNRARLGANPSEIFCEGAQLAIVSRTQEDVRIEIHLSLAGRRCWTSAKHA